VQARLSYEERFSPNTERHQGLPVELGHYRARERGRGQLAAEWARIQVAIAPTTSGSSPR